MKRLCQWTSFSLVFLAFAGWALAQQELGSQATRNVLVSLLQAKGLISDREAAMVNEASSGEGIEQRLAQLLLSKGLISPQEYERAIAPSLSVAAVSSSTAAPMPAVYVTARPVSVSRHELTPVTAGATQGQSEPKRVPAIAPLRVLPISIPKAEGLIPDIKLGSGAWLKPYGFFKISSAYQTTSHGGPTFGSNDFPQGPLLLGDTGPDGDPQFHIKSRAFRAGVDFAWPDLAKRITLTGKLEFDFEGNFTDVNNRNISANRSSQPSIRLAWVRLDTRIGDTPVFFQFGQDWSIFGSSTLMDLFETTGFGFAQGNLYERMPMFRTGVQLGKGDFKVQPEVAIALSGFGEPNLDVDQRLRFGGRVGPEGGQPELQSRLVFQFPVSRAPGVVPAQIIFSYDHARRAEIIQAANLPSGEIRTAFPTGVRLTSDRNAWSAEMQIPTSFVTVVSKYYRGGDLRYYFQGQFNDVFADLGGRHSIGTATTFSGRVIPFAISGDTVTPGSLEPVMGQGGFMQLGFPLSRIFGANPESRATAGWSFYMTYGIDSAFAKDAIRGNGLLRTDHGSGQLRYRFNRWCSFIQETTYLDTRTAGGVLKPFRGLPARSAHTIRNEFGTVCTF